jgi:hypothetical protein
MIVGLFAKLTEDAGLNMVTSKTTKWGDHKYLDAVPLVQQPIYEGGKNGL